MNTTAFKGSVVNFQDLLYSGSDNMQVGHGVKVSEISTKDFKQGPIQETGKDLDLAIDGTGFFAVQTSDGTIKYTRDGSFHKDALGRLVTGQGDIVQPPITFPSDTISTSISSTGVVSVVTASAPGQSKVLGQLQLTSFPNPSGLQAEAGNLYTQSADSGGPTTGNPGANGLGNLQQKALEQSNIDVTSEMVNLASAQQAFSANSRVVTTSDQVIQSALNIVH
jgi:flagellar basal-body rod protein FlgG